MQTLRSKRIPSPTTAREWEQLTLLPFVERRPESRATFRTQGGHAALERVYTPDHIADVDFAA